MSTVPIGSAAGYRDAVLLAVLAVALLGPIPRWLARTRWPVRDPRAGLTAWLALAGTAALVCDGALLAAGLAPVSAGSGLPGRLPALLVGAPGAALPWPNRLLLAAGLGLLGWQAAVAGYCLVALHTRRRRHVALLELVADWDQERDCLVVEHNIPLAYSVSGRQPVVVLSRACQQLREAGQLRAVLAHERAHLRGHHELLLEPFIAWRRAVPFLPAAGLALAEVSMLAEMLADDAAARAASAQDAVAALHRISAGPAPRPDGIALGLANGAWLPGSAALARIRRLLQPPAPLPERSRMLVRLAALALVALPAVLLLTGCAGSAAGAGAGAGAGGGGGAGGAPGPAPSVGSVLDKPLDPAVLALPLTDAQGHRFTLGSLAGKTVVLTDFLTTCQEICPMTSVNLRAAARAAAAAGLGGTVQFLEVTVDPGRDDPSRLAAYQRLYGSQPGWVLATAGSGTPALWRALGVAYLKVPEGKPPATDWLTGRPLTYDVEHQDVVFLIDGHGHERWLTEGDPNAQGQPLPVALQRFLDAQGRSNQSAPADQSWTAADIEAAVTYLTGRKLG